MFLLTEENLKREAKLQKSLAVPAKFEAPEADAVREIERLSKLFLYGVNVRRSDYAVESSAKSESSSGELIRAIAGATHRMSSVKGAPGPRAGGDWLLDGFTRNLLRPLFVNVRISTSPGNSLARIGKEISFSELMALIGSSRQWESTKLKTGVREREYRIRGEGIDERLIFLGHPLGLGSSTGMISGLKLWGRGKPRSLAGGNLKRAINAVLEDQTRRIDLSYEYERSPEALALPAALRAEIKRVLEAVGIPNGSYSREGFSSGKFPYRFTHAPIQGSSSALLFSRCSSCRTVDRLLVENGSYDGIRAAWELTEEQIGPWHERVCSRKRLLPAERSRLSFKEQPWEHKWLSTVA